MATVNKTIQLHTKHYSKKERLYREQAEKDMQLDRDQLCPPAWLSDEAALEFSRVVQQAAHIDILDNLDLGILAIYADNWARYVEAAERLQEEGLTQEGRVNDVQSPYIAIADKAAQMIMKCSSKLGLATTDRLKLVVPEKTEKPVNRYLELLSNG